MILCSSPEHPLGFHRWQPVLPPSNIPDPHSQRSCRNHRQLGLRCLRSVLCSEVGVDRRVASCDLGLDLIGSFAMLLCVVTAHYSKLLGCSQGVCHDLASMACPRHSYHSTHDVGHELARSEHSLIWWVIQQCGSSESGCLDRWERWRTIRARGASVCVLFDGKSRTRSFLPSAFEERT